MKDKKASKKKATCCCDAKKVKLQETVDWQSREIERLRKLVGEKFESREPYGFAGKYMASQRAIKSVDGRK